MSRRAATYDRPPEAYSRAYGAPSVIILYHAGGAGDYRVLDEAVTDEQWSRILTAAKKLLALNGDTLAVNRLEAFDFRLYEGRNHFNDEFQVLCAYVPADQYVQAEKQARSDEDRLAFKLIAEAVGKVSDFYVRFVAVGMDMSTLTGPSPVPPPKLGFSSEVTERALLESENALRTLGPAAAVDRAHTAIHGFLMAVCASSSIGLSRDPSITDALAALRDHHPAFASTGPHAQTIVSALRGITKILGALDRVRSNATLVHPNPDLLDAPEAMLMINCARTVLHYVDARIKQRETPEI